MASIIMKRGTLAEVNATAISDGQILFTTNQTYDKIYADVGTIRRQIGGFPTIDTVLNTGSNNPIANSPVATAINTINASLSYKPGDTFSVASNTPCSGFVSSSSTAIYFSITTQKSMANITNITLSCSDFTSRGINGYLTTDVNLSDSIYSTLCTKANNNTIQVRVTKSTAFSVTNNTPVICDGAMVFTFT